MPTVVAAPDKFRGTASAREIAAAIAAGARDVDPVWTCDEAPVADGGEGLLDVLGDPGVRRGRRTTRVVGPLGEVVEAEWRMLDVRVPTAVLEMARAAGLELAGGPEWNDPLRAATTGVGQLIMAAIAVGARRVIVGVGGSATTDGGQGCLDALEPRARLSGVELIVACDVTTTFVDAARVFARQKGATDKQVTLLTRRLERVAQLYEETYGVDVRDIEGSGAAGGLAGGLAAIGARLVPGFDLVADSIGLADRIERADLVITGEGFLDEQSFRGKAVGGVAALAAEVGVPVLVIAGDVYADVPLHDIEEGIEGDVSIVSLVARFGHDRAMTDVTGCVREVVTAELRGGRYGQRR